MYFFQDQHTLERRGPVKTEELMMLRASGEVGARTLIWTKGMKNWARLEKLPELVARIPEPCVSPKHTDEVEEEEAPRRTADSDVVTSGRDDDVDVVFESRFATEPGVQWDRTPGSMRSNDDDADDVHVQGEEEDEEEEEQEEEEEEEEEEQVHEDALDNEETFREESHEVSLFLREKVTQLELELASVNAESIHMRDMMEARRERQQEQEKVPTEQPDPADDSGAAQLAQMYDHHYMLLGHMQRILEQYCIVVDKYAGAAG